ncbi:MAG: class II aldolase/adducin family protein [Lachnospiraceae bacterium]|nr:class II aldolase/adducin family protein [Lachnospiraceae bacterium]
MSDEKKYMTDEEAKEAILDIGRRMYLRDFVSSNDGNISVKVSDTELWATPTGVSKGYIKIEQLVKMDMDGNVLEGTAKPSSEIKMHLGVYKEDPTVQAVTHAHPLVATALSIAGISLNKAVNTEAVLSLGNIGVAEYATPGTYEVPDSIASYVKDKNGVMLANHGALTWGDSIYQAFYALESLENCAKSEVLTHYILGKQNYLSDNQVATLMEVREKLGIKKGGIPVYTKENPNPESSDKENQFIEKIARRVADILKEEK